MTLPMQNVLHWIGKNTDSRSKTRTRLVKSNIASCYLQCDKRKKEKKTLRNRK